MPRNQIVINVDIGETRVALIENGIVTELHIERRGDRSVVGDVYLGRVTRVLPGMNAAFVDIGLERAAFLHFDDVVAEGELRDSARHEDDGETELSERPSRGDRGGDRGGERDRGERASEAGEPRQPQGTDARAGDREARQGPQGGERQGRGDRGRRGRGRGGRDQGAEARGERPARPNHAPTFEGIETQEVFERPEDSSYEDRDEELLVAPGGDRYEAAPSDAWDEGDERQGAAGDDRAGGVTDDDGDGSGAEAREEAREERADARDAREDRGEPEAREERPAKREERAGADERDERDERGEDDPAREGDDEAEGDGGDRDGDDAGDDSTGDEADEEQATLGDLISDSDTGAKAPAQGERSGESRGRDGRNDRGRRGGRNDRGRGRNDRGGDRQGQGQSQGQSQGQGQGQGQGQRRDDRGRGRNDRGQGQGQGQGGRDSRDQRDTRSDRRDDRGGDRGARGDRGNGTSGPRALPAGMQMLREGQDIIVQVSKGPISTKGARCTSHISLAGRYSVYMPTVDHVGVSKRIGNEKERKRLREVIEQLKPEKGGIIVRTASEGLTKKQLKNDVGYLVQLWGDIWKKREGSKAPSLLYSELDVVLRTVRDVMGPDIEKVLIDDKETHGRCQRFVEQFMPDRRDDVVLYSGNEPIFDAYGIEDEIARALARKVPLPSGGYLIIDEAEALTAIDVNSGRFVGKKDVEETVTQTNLEAVNEIAYQLRMRNLGGLIILDVIDMERSSNREKVYKALAEALKNDKAKTSILRISEMGLIEMTRKRTRESLGRQLYESCFYCDGTGHTQSKLTIAYEILRQIRRERDGLTGYTVIVNAHPAVADALKHEAREALEEAQRRHQRRIVVQPKPEYHIEQFDLQGR